MSGGTLSGLSGSGVATARTNAAKPAVKSTTNSTTSSNESSQITTNTGSPGAQKQTSGEDFSSRLATNMATAAANPYTAPAATPTQQGMDPAMMAMMSGMGGQKPQTSEPGGSKAGSQGSQAEQALQEMAQRFNNFRKEAGEKIAELTKGNKESPGDKVVAQALEKLTGKQSEPEAKKAEEKPTPKAINKTTSDISDGYDDNAFIA